MHLCAIVITSSTKAAIIGDALRSCIDWVDSVLVIHILDGGDATLSIAHDIAGAKLLRVDVPLPAPFDIAALRNFGLEEAAKFGADWAMQLDTDERMLTNGCNVRTALAKVPHDVEAVAVLEDFGRYDKPRFFRLPVQGAFKFPVHEEYVTLMKTTLMPTVRFHELEKPADYVPTYHRFQLDGIRQQLREDPTNPRWHYYLGLVLELTGQPEEAIEAYTDGLPFTKEPGSVAWSCFRIASCNRALGAYDAAIRACMTGLLYEASYAELHWMAGLCFHFLGQPRQAIAWAKSAIAHSWRRADNASLTRFGFKDVCALFEAPYEVLAESYKILGETGKEQWAAAEIQKARKERVKFFAQGC